MRGQDQRLQFWSPACRDLSVHEKEGRLENELPGKTVKATPSPRVAPVDVAGTGNLIGICGWLAASGLASGRISPEMSTFSSGVDAIAHPHIAVLSIVTVIACPAGKLLALGRFGHKVQDFGYHKSHATILSDSLVTFCTDAASGSS